MKDAKEYAMPSGAKLLVSVSAYDPVMDLHDAFVEELRGKGIGSLDVVEIQKTIQSKMAERAALAAGKPWEDDGEADVGLNVIVDKYMALIASKSLRTAIFACAAKAIYMPDGTMETSLPFLPGTSGFGVFDHPRHGLRARGDYYAICRAVAEENLRPFGKALFSMFGGLVEKRADTQESNTAKERMSVPS